ncbi:unnamed protein product [Schistosoma margrebowiei]|uniref:Uncharacterized protein n=1 Tax=Schistosoma margrebowiei TaxID=48269 RepID=A0A183MJ06_9TREM|nr:unnamed protein product [Schistosoma margrebowiei]
MTEIHTVDMLIKYNFRNQVSLFQFLLLILMLMSKF